MKENITRRFEIHSHTEYSNLRLRDSINKPKALIDRAIELGLKGIAITDHESLSSHIKVNQIMEKLKETNPDFKVALGNEIYLTETRDRNQRYYHFLLIAKNAIGYQALKEMSSISWMQSYVDRGMKRVPTLYSELERIVKKYPNSLIATTACFLPGQKVRTLRGEVNIEDITQNDYIMNAQGQWEKINFPTQRDYEDFGNELTFTKEEKPIKCTKNHQFLIYENKKLVWKEAEKLVKNDKCLEPIPVIEYTNNNIINVSKMTLIKKYREKSIGQNYSMNIFRMKDDILFTNEIMRFFGLWLADGHISIHEECNKHNVGFSFSEVEFDNYYNGFVKKALTDLGLSEQDYGIRHIPKNHKIELSINKVEFALFMKELFGLSHADNKYIPSRLIHINQNFDEELFFGYMLGDGYFRYREKQGGEVVSASISKQLTQDIHDLAISLNLSGTITTAKARVSQYNHKESYYFTLSNAALGKNLQKVSHISHEELHRILELGSIKKPQFIDFITIDGVKYRIKKVKKNTVININEKVYCLNTPSHNFVLNNIIVHNCLGGELSAMVAKLVEAERIGNEASAAEAHNRIIEFILWNKEMFGQDFYIECAPAASKMQIDVNKRLYSIAAAFDVKMVVGSDAHYLRKEDSFVHESYLNSKEGDREVRSFYEYAYLQTEEEIRTNLKFSEYSDEYIDSMFANSMEIYDKVEYYSLRRNQDIPMVEVKDYPYKEMHLEDHPVLNSMFQSPNNQERYWVNQCFEKLDEKGLLNKEYIDRLEEEADIQRVIGEKLNTNMFRYPITLQHYIDLIWECGSTIGAGRGSSCSGLNHYLLGVTQLDPIKWDLPYWRYLNKDRVELGDIDIDLAPDKRPLILKKIKEERGRNFDADVDDISRENLGCSLVATFSTESTKSAILTACRGYRTLDYPDGIDTDTAQYMSSLIPQERGFLWSLDEVINGDKEKGRKPVVNFLREVNQYDGLLKIMTSIEGLISNSSTHASGVILFDGNPYDKGCFMTSPNGDICTQWDLHDAEWAGMVKYDFLVTSVQSKLTQTINLLQEDNVLPRDMSLRQIYDKYLHPEALPIEDEEIWKHIQNNDILNLFQFDSDVGSQAVKKIKPTKMIELSDANGLMRLMTMEKGAESPMDKYVRFKNDISLWYKEMYNFGLTGQEQEVLEPYFLSSYGVPPSQEQLMKMLMDKNICGFTLSEANAARKIVGKKQMDKIPALREKILAQAKSKNLGNYVWKFGVGPQMGYSFSMIHALAYSFIAFQCAYLAVKFNPIYWNTACLIINSGTIEEDTIEDDEEVKEKGNDYAKTAKALGEILSRGINISLVNINKSSYSFRPDVEKNRILFALKALSGVNRETIDKIIAKRPYTSIKDFMQKVPLGKLPMISLIKSGAFDEISADWASSLKVEPRLAAMIYYLNSVSEPKKRLTLQNFNTLAERNLLPEELNFEKQVFIFNKSLKAKMKWKTYYLLKDIYYDFYKEYFDMDSITIEGGVPRIEQKAWDKQYQIVMDRAREWIKSHEEETLRELNFMLFKELWDKYADGNLSSWEMKSLCFYYHEHELSHINYKKYGISNFNSLPAEPEVDYYFNKKDIQIPIFKLTRIVGTVIAKNDARASVVLMTPDGLATVKFTKDYYAQYKRQISEVQEDGKKKTMEKGWFGRGNMLMITGFRRGDQFIAKTYKKTASEQIYKIIDITDSGDIELVHDRYGVDENE